MKLLDWFYSATDIARPFVVCDVPTRRQYAFLEWIRSNETSFLPPEWRDGDSGARAMNLAVQNAIDYLVDPRALEAERKAVEEEGGILPDSDSAVGPMQFLKGMRIEMALREFLGKKGAELKRMKCRTILKRCGVGRRNEAFCREFERAAAFYHVGLRRPWEEALFFSIENFRLDEPLILIRL